VRHREAALTRRAADLSVTSNVSLFGIAALMVRCVLLRVFPWPYCSAAEGTSVCYPTGRRPGVSAAPGRHSGRPRLARVVRAA
jgi:hypothetical protein